MYSLSFAPKAGWSRQFAPQPEIPQYLRDVARDFGVLPHIRFGTEVLGAAFDEDRGTWQPTLADGGGWGSAASSPPTAPSARSTRSSSAPASRPPSS